MIYELTEKTLPEFLELVRDASPSSGTHWSRCRGGQRIYARNWLASFEMKRRARRQARQAQAVVYFLAGFVLISTIWILKVAYK